MYLLYVDESGVTNPHPSQTSHYVMLGLAVHVGTWFALTRRVRNLKQVYALEGDRDTAFEWLNRSVALGNENKPVFEHDPNLADLRQDARWAELIKRITRT